MRVAILEDDTAQAAVLGAWLESIHAEVEYFLTGNDLIKSVRQRHFDLFLLDWQLPDTSGVKVLEWIREHLDWSVPIVFLTIRNSETDIVTALAAGADDYITKPLSFEVTLARIKSVLRRSGTLDRPDAFIEADPYRLDLINKQVMICEEPIKLTKREFELAAYIFRHIGRVLSRETLLQEVWGVKAVLHTRTVDTHICRLRTKLRFKAYDGWELSSIYQYGYRLEAAGG